MPEGLDPKQFSNDVLAAAAETLHDTLIVEGLTAQQVDDLDAAAGEMGIEFSYRQTEDGSYVLSLLGVTNGLLAQKNKTLVVEMWEDPNEFSGLRIDDDKRFGEPV